VSRKELAAVEPLLLQRSQSYAYRCW